MVFRKCYKDFYVDWEVLKYENLVFSCELILQVFDDQGKLFGKYDLVEFLDVDEDGEVGLECCFKVMLCDGQLVENCNGKVGIVLCMDLIVGWVQGYCDGFGFLIVDEFGCKDLFLVFWQMEKVMDGDWVLVSIVGVNCFGKEEVCIVEIIECVVIEIVGCYYCEVGVSFIELENCCIIKEVLVEDFNGIKLEYGDYVCVEIIQYLFCDQYVLV